MRNGNKKIQTVLHHFLSEITDEACDEEFVEKDLIDNDAKGFYFTLKQLIHKLHSPWVTFQVKSFSDHAFYSKERSNLEMYLSLYLWTVIQSVPHQQDTCFKYLAMFQGFCEVFFVVNYGFIAVENCMIFAGIFVESQKNFSD